MKRMPPRFCTFVLLSTILSYASFAQTASSPVPPMVKYSGSAAPGTSTGTFAIYERQDAAVPLWIESQSVTADETGHYTVLLGSTSAEGLPSSAFASGEARWIGVKLGDNPEGTRTMLVSVPYAMKAANAETLGGKPLSAFVLADDLATDLSRNTAVSRLRRYDNGSTDGLSLPGAQGDIGSQNFLAKFLADGVTLGNSGLFENGANVGIGTIAPTATLDVATPGASIGLGTNFAGLNQLVK